MNEMSRISAQPAYSDAVQAVLKRAPRADLGAPGSIAASRPPILVPQVVEHEPSGHDDQPGGEAAPAVRDVSAETAMVILSQSFEHERVRVHGDIVVAGDRAAGAQHEVAVRRDEVGPRRLPLRVIARPLEAGNGCRITEMQNVGRRGPSAR